jgi:hypothetical protein
VVTSANRSHDEEAAREAASGFCGAVAGNNAFHFVNEFAGTSGEPIIEHLRDGGTLIVGDTDGDGFHDLMIQVHEVTTGALSVDDFIL